MKLIRPLFFYSLLAVLLLNGACKSANDAIGGKEHHAYTNALVNESSPYLLQHAHNPVDWNPWKEEALTLAKTENKLMIISIGYAACHWCHVMEEESFEDTTVSRIMNEFFIPIKVDREERPDVDDVYMTACHMATGRSCGWPLNAFALPDGRPVWAGTYFPKKQWLEILEYFTKLWQDEPEKLLEYAEKLTQGIQANDQIEFSENSAQLTAEILREAAEQTLENIDFKKGGRIGSPKFPMPNNYEFLLEAAFQSGNEQALQAVDVTLQEIAKGGIYDQLGGGFARYSTDDRWRIPHFEKMLYDNGQLISLYSKAYQHTRNADYARIVEESLAFIEREMTSPEGGFYSSFDADSEGEEGVFYVWQKEEIDSILKDKRSSDLFCQYYNVRKNGNWEGKNILFITDGLEKAAAQANVPLPQAQEMIAGAKNKLFKARTQRVHPKLDDKILTSWNALMLQGYVDAYKALGKEKYRQAALKNARFLQQNMLQADYRLNRNYKDGKSVINAFLDDYANLIQAYVGLYEITFDAEWLRSALKLSEYAQEHFFDETSGLFFYTSNLDPALIARKKETADNVIPASNSVMARNLHTLGLYFYRQDLLDLSQEMLSKIEKSMREADQAGFYSNWWQLYQDLLKPPYEVAIIGPDWEAKRAQMQSSYLPNALFLGGASEGELKLLENKLVEGETRIYVCQAKVCKMPVTEVEKALELMND